jgi:hypothetical protein
VRGHLCGVMESDDNNGVMGSHFYLIYPRKKDKNTSRQRKLHKENMIKNKSFNLIHRLDLVAIHLHLIVPKPLDLEEQ